MVYFNLQCSNGDDHDEGVDDEDGNVDDEDGNVDYCDQEKKNDDLEASLGLTRVVVKHPVKPHLARAPLHHQPLQMYFVRIAMVMVLVMVMVMVMVIVMVMAR